MKRLGSALLLLLLAACASLPSSSPARIEIFELTDTTFERTRNIRVWLPKGYDEAEGPFPVFYMFDGQNLFDAALSEYSGAEWEADETAARLIREGKIAPIIIVGIDNAGIHRSAEYLPFGEPMVGLADEEAMGTALDQFFRQDIFPLIEEKYKASTDDRALGGSSFGGIATLTVAMDDPSLFSRLLVESPSLWVSEFRVMEKIKESRPEIWPARIYTAMGTREITGTCPAAPQERDEQLVTLHLQMTDYLRGKGLGADRLLAVIDECAIHSEVAWAKRFPQALEFLYAE